jgi:hypothetical protein
MPTIDALMNGNVDTVHRDYEQLIDLGSYVRLAPSLPVAVRLDDYKTTEEIFAGLAETTLAKNKASIDDWFCRDRFEPLSLPRSSSFSDIARIERFRMPNRYLGSNLLK